MNKTEIKHTQKVIGTDADGFWGPKSTAAAKRHLRKLVPADLSLPTQTKVRSGRSIYGKHGVKDGYSPPSERIQLPFSLWLYGDRSKKVRTLDVHPEAAASLLLVFENLAEVYPDTAARKKSGILRYYGIYNPRPVRGGSVQSMHSYRIAIDIDANRNRNRSHWPTVSKMPIEVMECFARQGWLSAGAFWSRDAMHFQRTSE